MVGGVCRVFEDRVYGGDDGGGDDEPTQIDSKQAQPAAAHAELAE